MATENEPIAFVDLKAQYELLKQSIDARIAGVLEHGRFILGPEVQEFEEALATYAGVGHAVGVANGTEALQIALMAAGVGPGDAVFLPSFTFTATAEAALICGAEPVFCEVDSRTFNIEPSDLEQRIELVKAEGRLCPKAIIAVDLFGQPAEYDILNALAETHGLLLVADAAQSFGARLGNKRVGSLAPVTATSFFPSKPLGCYGDGGALLTDDDDMADSYRSIRAHGKGGGKYDIVRVGLNSRLDTLQAAVLLAKLDVFEDEMEKRNNLAATYSGALDSTVLTPHIADGVTSAWAQYAILVEDRDTLARELKSKGIPTAVYYPLPMHLQSAYKEYGGGAGALPVSEDLSKRILCLPMHPYLPPDHVEFITETLIKAARALEANVTPT